MGRVTVVRVAHTADLDAATLIAARTLLEDVFAGELDDDDWEHALGGVHALAYDAGDATLVGHAAVVQRRLVHAGRALRAGYVEAVGVRAGHRRRGVGAALMAPLERIVRNAYDLGALGATDMAVPFYTGRGWRRWRGEPRALPPEGVLRPSPEEGPIYVLAVDGTPLDLDAP